MNKKELKEKIIELVWREYPDIIVSIREADVSLLRINVLSKNFNLNSCIDAYKIQQILKSTLKDIKIIVVNANSISYS